ncbi:hypothetical protein CRV15_28565 (plasmid) [Streptomyces clavuligerus]|uniref:WD40 repeat domain-containing protein n=1 Tax=Streptomyces clavuligerus TaxID=1901 RepID=B5GW21_STRCL|nr:hypothetical protein SSCG_03664 [Streptomyces clavuligerus]EFG03580.1 Hypothetical protein SCLAV_p0089 [Streptomyces clavuligerus]MBY6307842.1 hypothetical protein [Streptomyces clavuligerus]QCS09605.1 hypothetical protein CRV15_28565 [Streptomyces clavuligerus]QPJ98346.1 hypothetical protein GE265_35760 [Streptomyces clavuligerus]
MCRGPTVRPARGTQQGKQASGPPTRVSLAPGPGLGPSTIRSPPRSLLSCVARPHRPTRSPGRTSGQPRHQLGDSWASDVALGLLDGVPVAVTADYFTVGIWDLGNGARLHEIHLPVDPHAVVFAPGGELVIGAGYEAIVLER